MLLGLGVRKSFGSLLVECVGTLVWTALCEWNSTLTQQAKLVSEVELLMIAKQEFLHGVREPW